jgi:transcriptional regulator PpsR
LKTPRSTQVSVADLAKDGLLASPSGGLSQPLVEYFSNSAASTLHELLCAASDFSLGIDKLGIIRALDIHRESAQKELKRFVSQHWLGKAWVDVVTPESRPKVVAMLRDAAMRASKVAAKKSNARNEALEWRQINYPKSDGAGPDLPVETAVIKAGDDGELVVLSRDLSAMAALQQQLINTQQNMERDYMSLRYMESRYRALLQTSMQGIALVEVNSLKVHDANEQAFRFLDEGTKRKPGRIFSEYFEIESRTQLTSWLGKLASSRSIAPSLDLLLKDSRTPVRLHASMLRQADGVFHLIWLSSAVDSASHVLVSESPEFSAVFDQLPEGFLLLDAEGKILRANAAFASMVQVVDGAHAVGEKVSRWFARSELDFSLIVNALRQHTSFKQISTEIKGEFGSSTLAEISGVVVQNAQMNVYGLCIRDVSRRAVPDDGAPRVMPRSVSELKELVGRVSLKEIVGETTDVIEQLCIEAALELTGDNRAAASEMLGLSRQSLYVKLRRFGVDTSADSGHDGSLN